MTTNACVLAGVLLLAGGCPGREAPRKATPEACRNACKHVVELQQEASRASARIRAHELEEMFEAQQESAKQNVARLRKEMEAPQQKFEDTPEAHRKGPPALRAQLRAMHQQQLDELRKQRLAGIDNEEQALKRSAATLAEVKTGTETALGKSLDDEIKKCNDDCAATRTATEVRCLQLAQAPDDVDQCLKTSPPRTDAGATR